MIDQITTYHVATHPFSAKEESFFGHVNSMITFQEGILAKKVDVGEYNFFEACRNEFKQKEITNMDGYIPVYHGAVVILRKSPNPLTNPHPGAPDPSDVQPNPLHFSTKPFPRKFTTSEFDEHRAKKKEKKKHMEHEYVQPLTNGQELVLYPVEGADDLVDENKLIAQLNRKYDLKLSADQNNEVRTYLVNGRKDLLNSLFILQNDINSTHNLTWPVSTMDLKIGIRSWRLGASKNKAERRAKKNSRGPNGKYHFRVRGALYLEKKNEGSNCFTAVPREFGETCTEEELITVLTDFFKYKDQIPAVIDKLVKMNEKCKALEEDYKVRFYSSSVVFMYCDRSITKKTGDQVVCTLLDFEKAYVHTDVEAKAMNIPFEECNDGVVDAISNIIKLLQTLL